MSFPTVCLADVFFFYTRSVLTGSNVFELPEKLQSLYTKFASCNGLLKIQLGILFCVWGLKCVIGEYKVCRLNRSNKGSEVSVEVRKLLFSSSRGD